MDKKQLTTSDFVMYATWILFLVFFTLKVTGAVNWSWAMVLLPLWITQVFAVTVGLFIFVVGLLHLLAEAIVSSLS